MINVIPVIGWILSLLFSMSLAVPFWLCWTVCGIGQRYFYFLPEVYQSIGFWNAVGLFLVASILKSTLMPRFYSTFSASSETAKKQ